MNQRQIFDELLSILRTEEDVDILGLRLDDTPFKAYGIDSLCLMQMLASIEERFRIEIEEIEIFEATDFLKLTALIQSKIAPFIADGMRFKAVENA